MKVPDSFDRWLADNLLAAGFVTGVLYESDSFSEIDVLRDDHGNYTNMVEVRIEGFKSKYRITVEIVPGTEREE